MNRKIRFKRKFLSIKKSDCIFPIDKLEIFSLDLKSIDEISNNLKIE